MKSTMSNGDAVVRFKDIRKSYGVHSVLQGVSLDVHAGELLCLLGPSGCGKTTTLRILAGLADPTSGEVHLAGENITRTPTYARDIGLVFQNYALFPHMTIAANIEYGLANIRTPKNRRGAIITEMLRRVELEHVAERYPSALSGGQQQRAALARALALQPKVLLLDEPFSNLDAQLRVRLRDSLHALVKSLEMTTIFVTHDQEEALMLADRIVVMNAGRIEQIGSPEDIYHRPATRFVAEFIGSCTLLEGVFENGRFVSDKGLELDVEGGGTGRGALVVRPEHLALHRPGDDRPAHAGVVRSSTYRGALTNLRVAVGPEELLMEGHFPPGQQPREGDRIPITFERNAMCRVD